MKRGDHSDQSPLSRWWLGSLTGGLLRGLAVFLILVRQVNHRLHGHKEHGLCSGHGLCLLRDSSSVASVVSRCLWCCCGALSRGINSMK